jgi:hypothetical protein
MTQHVEPQRAIPRTSDVLKTHVDIDNRIPYQLRWRFVLRRQMQRRAVRRNQSPLKPTC